MMVRMCALGKGPARRWITDPLSLPDGTPVTKVGLDRGAKGEWVSSVADSDAVGRT